MEPEIVLLEDLRYEPESDTVLQRKKGADGTVQWQRLSEGDFRALVAGLDPGDSGVSAATLSRALVAKSEVEGYGSGLGSSSDLADQERNGGGVASDRGGVELFRLLGPDAKPNYLFYSQQQGNNLEGSAPGARPVQRTGVTQAEVDETMKRTDVLAKLIKGHFDVEYYPLEEFGAWMRSRDLPADHKEVQRLFREQLQAAIEDVGLVSPRDFERWTNVDAEDQSAVQHHLQELWDVCFGEPKKSK
ncbi:hypothetical protein [Verrucomicrobium spinosum]|uniref:hypothetical protein n=1 Tax=Verrucomicrobium spinosum TaxID=2736 RepID=UPI00155DC17D|nr:hypothetical protein [Verrucomicrobium spinosum]